ncbi:MAG: hypothetical protein ACE5LB_13835 [Acidiferrobacterales bacterium]
MSQTQDYSAQLWLRDKRWRNGVVESTASKEMGLFIVMALLWNAFTIPMTWFIAVPEFQKGNQAAAVIGLFVLAGVYLAYKAVKNVVQWWRFGALKLTLDPFPGALDGDVGGTIEIPVRGLPRRKVQITLNCVHVRISSSGKNRTRHEHVVWRERGMVDPEPGVRGWRLPFKFAVAADLPESSPPSNNYHEWIVHVECDLPGADIDRSFAVPVLKNAGSQRSSVSSGYLQHETPARQLSPSIARVSHGPQGLLIYYPLTRNITMGLMTFIFGLIFLGFPAYMAHQMIAAGFATGPMDGFVVGVSGMIALVFALVALLLIVLGLYLLGNTLTVTIAADGVHTVRRVYGIPFRRYAPRDEVVDLGSKITSQRGQGAKATVRHTLMAKTQSGRAITLGDGVRGVANAKALMRVMREALNLPPPE